MRLHTQDVLVDRELDPRARRMVIWKFFCTFATDQSPTTSRWNDDTQRTADEYQTREDNFTTTSKMGGLPHPAKTNDTIETDN